jgi:hypothetical protein
VETRAFDASQRGGHLLSSVHRDLDDIRAQLFGCSRCSEECPYAVGNALPFPVNLVETRRHEGDISQQTCRALWLLRKIYQGKIGEIWLACIPWKVLLVASVGNYANGTFYDLL